TSVRLRAKLDAPGWTERAVRVSEVSFVGAVEQRAFVISTHLAVGDRHILRRPRIAQTERTLETDTVVERRVDRRIRDTDVLAGIDIHAVAIGVDLHVVDREVVDAGGQYSEVTTVKDADVANEHVPTELQSNRLVT